MPKEITFNPDQEKDIVNLYTKNKMPMDEMARQSKSILGFNVCHATLKKILIKNKVELRSISEQKCKLSNLDETFLTEEMLEWIDGFLLGDGAIHLRKKRFLEYGKVIGNKFTMSSVQKEWTEYAMSKFGKYGKGEIKTIDRRSDPRCPNILWRQTTLSHPDINFQAIRWYGQNKDYKKDIPEDVRITPISLLLWYLGDGCLSFYKKTHCWFITLCTDSFSEKSIKNILVPRFNDLGIPISVFKNNKGHFRIKFYGKNVLRFFNVIGREPPISCYDYKFRVPSQMYLLALSDLNFNKKEMARAHYVIGKNKSAFSKPCNHREWKLTKEDVVKLKRQMATYS